MYMGCNLVMRPEILNGMETLGRKSRGNFNVRVFKHVTITASKQLFAVKFKILHNPEKFILPITLFYFKIIIITRHELINIMLYVKIKI